MHLLLIHQAFATPKDSGGTRHYELAQAAMKSGHRFTVVTSDFGYMAGARDSGLTVVDGITVHRVHEPHTGHRGFVGQLVALVTFAFASIFTALRVKDVDVVMGTSPSIFQAASAWLVSALRGKPLLLEIRDLWPEFIIDMGRLKNPLAIWFARRLEAFLYARADHLLVNSPAYVEYLVEHGVARERVSFIPNGVDPSMFDDVTAEDARSERELLGAGDKCLVMYAGVLGPANDIETVLDAAELLRHRSDILIALVGDGKSRKALEAAATARNLANVVFGGHRPKSRMGAALAASDVCLATLQNIPMFRTTYPNKVFDYLAAGRPIILGIDGVIRDVVEAAGAGTFVQPGDAKQLASAIEAMAARSDRRELGQRGKDYVARHFNRHDHGVAFTKLLERLAG